LNEHIVTELIRAGLKRYHCNLEACKSYFPQVCTTHTWEEKAATLKMARDHGLSLCSGGIIGMGETWDDRIDMALTLAELGIESIPLNALMPIKGTPLQDTPQITAEDVARTVAIFRFINPTANIRLGAGRGILPKSGETVIGRGASASITGNMLTTSGTTIKEDMELLARLGLSNADEDCRQSRGTCGAR